MLFKQTLLLGICMGLRKAHDVLDWEYFLGILWGYGVRSMVLILLRVYYSLQHNFSKTMGWFRENVLVTHGVTQGGRMSPAMFNIIVNIVMRYCMVKLCDTEVSN